MEGLDFITLYVALSPGQVESVIGGGVALPQESSQRFGLRVNKEMQYNAVMILPNGNGFMSLPVGTHSATRILLSALFGCQPSDTFRRAWEMSWFERNQQSFDGEEEFNIRKS